MLFRHQIEKSIQVDVLAVPIDGVQINGDRKYVLVVENGETKEVDIETGLSNDEYVEVKSGLSGGETIQVVTTTKQSTIRNNSNSKGGNSGMMGKDQGTTSGGDRQSMPNMNSGMQGGGSMPSGGSAPSAPGQ